MTWTETEESAEFWGNVAQGYAADAYETERGDELEIEDDSMYMGSDSDFADHALGIDY